MVMEIACAAAADLPEDEVSTVWDLLWDQWWASVLTTWMTKVALMKGCQSKLDPDKKTNQTDHMDHTHV